MTSEKGDVANKDPSNNDVELKTNVSRNGAPLSENSEEVALLWDKDEDDDANDRESSKLVCVVGVERDEVGESAVKNFDIGLNSKVRSLKFSLMKEVRRSLWSRKVVGVEDIKAGAGADWPVKSGFMLAGARLRGVGGYLRE